MLPGDTARLDAELLLAHLLGIERTQLLLGRLDDEIDEPAYEALVARRLQGEPVAYILGHREFWSLDLLVTPDVLIPRPDSETLVEAALAAHPSGGVSRILDLGTGSGALLLAALSEWPEAWGLGVDRSEAAARIARRNAARLGLADRAAFMVGHWADAIDGRFDVILCNPPYIGLDEALSPEVRDHEPASALFAGPEGLDDYRLIVPRLVALLAPDGSAHLEIGTTQADLVTRLVVEAGLEPSIRHDLAGHPRCVSAIRAMK